MSEPTRDEVRATLTSHAEEYEHWAAHEDETVVRDTYLESAALYRHALALLDEGEKDTERLDWLETTGCYVTVSPTEYVAAKLPGFRAAIDQARGA